MPRNLEDRSLTARDKLLRDSFTPAERFLAWTLCISAAAVFLYWTASLLLDPWVLVDQRGAHSGHPEDP